MAIYEERLANDLSGIRNKIAEVGGQVDEALDRTQIPNLNPVLIGAVDQEAPDRQNLAMSDPDSWICRVVRT